MKKITVFLISFLFLSSFSYSQISLGVGLNYISNGSVIGLGGKALYEHDQNFGGQLAIHYIFAEGVDFIVDLDFHYDGLQWGSKNLRVTPFVGLNQSGGVTVRSNGQTVAGGSSSSSRFNIGVNGKVPIGDDLRLYIEPKFILGRASAFSLSSGVYF